MGRPVGLLEELGYFHGFCVVQYVFALEKFGLKTGSIIRVVCHTVPRKIPKQLPRTGSNKKSTE
jgi:hypothetical protein